MKIHKYTIADPGPVLVPTGAQILDVQLQHGSPVLWAACEPELPMDDKRVLAVLTGGDVAPGWAQHHFKTLQDAHGFVWHIFADTRARP